MADAAFADALAELSSRGAPEQKRYGVSILKEVFPEHGAGIGPGASMAPPPSILEQLLGSIATPSRSVPPGGGQRNPVPCVPPAQPPALSVASLAPPPPP